ncbi:MULTISPECIES: RNA methyltransferase [unclassified Paenibacillus]|uniref:TrmH family RNA methyltransferase n=1 Tax=unclassified Paenibacillus TaxID=185978 RepID=UPI001C10A99A|nr:MULTISPECIES: RNA methyltransferase [unclassified Paenibacillus]MBU5441382.1 RNA methyltransferase [Paenibacillus sp. MSJ-34]CAH0118248.1 23S rRNA (uridine(2479)-2'-O)-methyltransferase [Paenibacillus sp. CECT 9249]
MEITSNQNPRVKLWAQLLNKKHRDKQRKFLIEGIHLVQEALAANTDIECIVYSIEQGLPAEIERSARDRLNVEWIGTTDAIIAKCSDTLTPQPIFAVIRKGSSHADELLNRKQALVVAVDGVQDPGNLGTIIRSADAVGADGVVIGKGSVDLYNPKTIRATMGSIFHLPIVEGDLAELLPLAKERGVHIVSTSLQAERHCYSYDFNQSTWLLVGNEAKGVSAAASAWIDDAIIIPMHGEAESLNVAMATSVLLYEALRQRHYGER